MHVASPELQEAAEAIAEHLHERDFSSLLDLYKRIKELIVIEYVGEDIIELNKTLFQVDLIFEMLVTNC